MTTEREQPYQCPSCREPFVLGVTSLRDYFAAQALTGLLDPKNIAATATTYPSGNMADRMADMAYELADAMLERRVKP